MGAMATAAGAEQMPLPVMQRLRGGRVEEAPGEYRSVTPAEAAGGEQHARIPAVVLDTAGLSMGAKMTYGVLQRHVGGNAECWPAHAAIAAQASCSERSVRTYLAELEAAGFVRHVRGGAARNRYRLYPKGGAPAESGNPCRNNPATVAGMAVAAGSESGKFCQRY